MGKRTPSGREAARTVYSQSITANGDYGPFEVVGVMNLSCGGALPTGATVSVHDSYDGGSNYYPTPANASGDAIVWDDTVATPRCVLEEVEPGVLYIVRVAGSWTGTIPLRLSA